MLHDAFGQGQLQVKAGEWVPFDFLCLWARGSNNGKMNFRIWAWSYNSCSSLQTKIRVVNGKSLLPLCQAHSAVVKVLNSLYAELGSSGQREQSRRILLLMTSVKGTWLLCDSSDIKTSFRSFNSTSSTVHGQKIPQVAALLDSPPWPSFDVPSHSQVLSQQSL